MQNGFLLKKKLAILHLFEIKCNTFSKNNTFNPYDWHIKFDMLRNIALREL